MAKKNFEQAIAKLEEIVGELESGDLSLENSVKKFEEGIKLSNLCFEKLDETEKKITILMKKDDDTISEEPFI